MLIALAAALAGGIELRSGFGLWVDVLIALLALLPALGLAALAMALVLNLLSRLPGYLSGIVLGACLIMSFVLPASGLVLVTLAIVSGSSLATLVSRRFGAAHWSKKVLTVVLALASLAGLLTVAWKLGSDGSEQDRVKTSAAVGPQALQSANPSDLGTFAVKRLFYGSGTDPRRSEYGNQVTIKTLAVNASPFFKGFSGWKEKLRRYYWGFGVDRFPLNARVWYPDGAGPFALVLIVHGSHSMAEFSDSGYAYLGELLASRGFIVASIDENFLNGWLANLPKEQAARGWMLLEHLKLWRNWQNQPGNPFAGKVDLENIALIGHSRGGEAVATAALFNRLEVDPDDATIRLGYGFNIKSVVAIAPADGQYKPAGEPRTLRNLNYLTLQGADDSDVPTFMGSWQFDRVKFTDPCGPWFKSELYIYGADHSQFNTVWGRSDMGEPTSRYLDVKSLLSAEDQQRIAKTYISAFLEATLHNKTEYVPLFRDYRRGRNWLPATAYVNRYFDASYLPVADFSEDADLTSTTLSGGRIAANLPVWREGPIPMRSGNRGYNGVTLGWNRKSSGQAPVYGITLPPGATLERTLVLSVAVSDEAPPGPSPDVQASKDAATNFSIELETISGTKKVLPLSRFGTLLPPLRVRFTKFTMIENRFFDKPTEPVFQTFELPLRDFGVDDPRQLHVMRLRFDKTAAAVIILSHVGFER